MFERASKIMPGGQSHNARFFDPYPFFAARAKGKNIWDIDGNKYTDYWMGHTALILGHSPEIVSKVLKRESSKGLLLGTPNEYAFRLAELVAESVPCAESIRFCTTGAEATMYAVRLARAFTGRNVVAKMAGGWHGYNSALTRGVSPPYDVPESAGLVDDGDGHIILANFNDFAATRRVLDGAGDRLAGVIVEPVMGAGGVLAAEKSYLQLLRDKCSEHGAILIFDEIITGFRLGLGGAQEYYRIKPDLCALGKILGGGLPVSAVAGRSDILSLADVSNKTKTQRCWIGGGTFSENALCMKAGIATLEHLVNNRRDIYSTIGSLGSKLRSSVDKTLSRAGLETKSTGVGSLFTTHFLSKGQESVSNPAEVNATDKKLQHEYYFSLISNNRIFFLPGHVGAISTSHSETDAEKFISATESWAKRITR